MSGTRRKLGTHPPTCSRRSPPSKGGQGTRDAPGPAFFPGPCFLPGTVPACMPRHCGTGEFQSLMIQLSPTADLPGPFYLYPPHGASIAGGCGNRILPVRYGVRWQGAARHRFVRESQANARRRAFCADRKAASLPPQYKKRAGTRITKPACLQTCYPAIEGLRPPSPAASGTGDAGYSCFYCSFQILRGVLDWLRRGSEQAAGPQTRRYFCHASI